MGAFGLGIVQEQATSIGITAVPHPIADSSSGLWFTWVPFVGLFLFSSAVGVHPQRATNYVIDSKVMRKFGANERLAIVIENEEGSSGLQFWYTLRILSKLP